jgi:cytochrome b subunit of formate dehydrogenase
MVGPIWQARTAFCDDQNRFRIRLLLRYLFGSESPLLTPHDLKCFWSHARWFFFRGPEPQFGRYRYWEKLDYLALLLGIAVIGSSGLILWLPETATLLLPGWIINVAQTIHSEEALLVVTFIVAAHVFHLVPRFFFAPDRTVKARRSTSISIPPDAPLSALDTDC